jgi:hypothetical protein
MNEELFGFLVNAGGIVICYPFFMVICHFILKLQHPHLKDTPFTLNLFRYIRELQKRKDPNYVQAEPDLKPKIEGIFFR